MVTILDSTRSSLMKLSYVFTFLVATVSASTLPVKRTVAQVEADIANIATQVATLDSAIDAYPNPGGTLAGALVGV